jgi:hypothetical protein
LRAINKPTTTEELTLARDLRDRGVSFDEDEFERMEEDCRGLSILQNNDVPSSVFDLPSGGAGFLFSALIYNESKRILSPKIVTFDDPPWEQQVILLPEPGQKKPYCFPDPYPDVYEREVVLNHLIGRSHILAPGAFVDGFLLAVGQNDIPLKYRDRSWLKVRVTLFDQNGRCQQAIFRLLIERGTKQKRALERIEAIGRFKSVPRKNIFESEPEAAPLTHENKEGGI